MDFDWTKQVVIDWSGRSGPLITENDLNNSVIKRILRNQFYAPFCEREYISVKPWWNPQDPFGSHSGNGNGKYNIMFVPGLKPLPLYPQQSTLTKEQHLQGLKAISTRFQFVQPRNYPQPTKKDLAAVEGFRELYEAEQKEYLKWAKLLWLNGHCLRALRPKPTIERVYDAEFRMRAYEMLSMPQEYSLAAQIPLEKENGTCELELKEDLINVNVQDLPEVDYPEEMERDFSVLMKSCPVPEPCKEHPCKFVLPHENTVSVLPLSEIHRELAQYAASNGSTFVASENALRCLLEADRSWKIPISVVEVICPEYGDLKTIVVLGSEFHEQKECSTQRTYKAYKHLLRHSFVPSTGQYKSKSPTKQDRSPQKITSSPPVIKETIALRNSRFVSLGDDLEVSTDEDSNEKLLIADESKKLIDMFEPNKEPDRLLINKSIGEPIDGPIGRPDQYIDETSMEPDQLIVDNPSNTNQGCNYSLDSYDPIDRGTTEPDNAHECIDKPSSEPDRLMTNNPSYTNPVQSYGLDFYEPDFNRDSIPSYSQNEPFRLMMDNASKNNPKSSYGLDFYQPDYSIDTRPNYSRDDDEPSSEPDKLMISVTSKINPELIRESSQAHPEPSCSRSSHESNYDRPSYSNVEPSSELDQLMVDSLSECNPESNGVLNFYDLDDDTRQSESHDKPDNDPNQLMINDDKINSNTNDDTAQALKTNVTAAPIFKTNNVSMFDINDLDDDIRQSDGYDEPDSEPDQLMINNDKINSDTNNDTAQALKTNVTAAPMFKTKNGSMFDLNDLDDDIRQSDGYDEPDSEPDQLMINNDKINSYTNDDTVQALKTNETATPMFETKNVINNFGDYTRQSNSVESDSEPDQLMINDNKSNSENNDDTALKHNETATPIFKTKIVSTFEIDDETAQMPQISDILGTNTLKDTNKKLNSSLAKSETQDTRHSSADKVDDITCQVAVPTKHIEPKYDTNTNEPTLTLSSKQSTVKCQIQNVEAPKTPTPVKPCRISVRNLSISELKSYNLAAFFNSTKTDVTEKTNSVTQNNDDVSIINESPEKSPEDPARLGISGIITKKRSSISRFVISEIKSKNQSSPKKIDSNLLAISDTVNTKDVPTKPEISEIMTINHSSIGTCTNTINDPMIEKAKEVLRLGITGMVTRNRSLSGTGNIIEGIEPYTEKSKEVSPKKEITGTINRNLTSPTVSRVNDLSKTVSIEPVRNIYTKIRKISDRVENIELKNTTTENLKLQKAQNISDHKNGVIERILKTNLELSPVKPCTVSVEKIDVEPYIRKRISETCVLDVEPITEKLNSDGLKTNAGFSRTNIVDAGTGHTKANSAVKTISRKRSISKSNIGVPNVIEPHNRYMNLKTYSRQFKNNESAAKIIRLNKSPLKPCTEKISISNRSIETKPIFTLNDSNQPSTKRVRKLSDQFILKHGYSQITGNQTEPRKRSINETDHDYCGSDASFDEESDIDMLFVDCSSNVDNIALQNFDIIEPTFHTPISINKNPSNVPDVRNITSNITINRKNQTEQIFSDLFGDDSDDEPMLHNSDKNTTSASDSISVGRDQKHDTRKLSFNDIERTGFIYKKSPPKPCFIKSSSDSPINSKRKLSFNDPMTSDPEFNTSISEPGSEDGIAGFINGVAVLCKTLTKDIKKKQNSAVNRTYGLRSRNKQIPARNAKPITTEQSKDKSRLTKITSNKQMKTRNIQNRISCSNSDSNDSESSSRHKSLASKQNINKNKGIIENISLRKSRRLSTRVNAKSMDVVACTKEQTAKTNVKESSQITEARRSRRISDRTVAKENMQSDTTKNTENSPAKPLSKDKRDMKSRKSRPSKTFSDINQSNQIIRSKSLTNLNDTRHLSQSYSYITRSKSLNRDGLKLSERTKRYLRRVFNVDDSASDQSDGESQRTQRYFRRISSSSGAKLSGTEIKKPCTRSSLTPYSKDAKKTNRSKNKTDLSEKTRRYTFRSAAAYSSCDETEQPERIRRTKTKKPRQIDRNRSTITVDSSAESNAEQFEMNNLKNKPMDTTQITDLANIDINQSTSANDADMCQIKIDLFEETDNVDNETLQVLHFIELPMNPGEEKSSHANEIQMNDENLSMVNNMECNETEHDENLFNNIATKINVDTKFDDIHSKTADASEVMNLTIEMNETESNENCIEIQRHQNKEKKQMNTKGIIESQKRSFQNNYVQEDSDSSDFFNMCVNQEFNILHFTARNENDSEESVDEDSLIIDDAPSTSNKVTDYVEQSKNNDQAKDKQPNTSASYNLFGESSAHLISNTRYVERVGTKTPSVSPSNKLRSKDEKILSHFAKSDDLSSKNKALINKSLPKDVVNDVIGVFNCTCKGTPFEVPPPRSYKKWRLRNKESQVGFNVIVHSSHKARNGKGEVLLEPIVEYQPELGGSRPRVGRRRGLALALKLRDRASLINVRIDHDNGNVIVVEPVSGAEPAGTGAEPAGTSAEPAGTGAEPAGLADTLHTALDQLRFLRPGDYVLAHHPSHGNNAMLYSAKGRGEPGLSLRLGNVNMPDAEDATYAKIPPDLDLVMMPYHKYRGLLPLAFTPYKLGKKEDKKMAAALARTRAPPAAIQWPKKKKSRKRSRRQAASQPQE